MECRNCCKICKKQPKEPEKHPYGSEWIWCSKDKTERHRNTLYCCKDSTKNKKIKRLEIINFDEEFPILKRLKDSGYTYAELRDYISEKYQLSCSIPFIERHYKLYLGGAK